MEQHAQGFIRWRNNGAWEKLLAIMIDEPDMEWLMANATHVKAHPHAAGARGGNEAIGLTKGEKYKDTSGRGYIWSSAQSLCHCGY